ncbi:MAG: FadR family transcriptional regulator [Acidobacteria bacterium]|nr:FadR family transcriptional regulator [Acidobacteriota bacterium]MCI0721682.1 FadR family transcriptional regulator [Acidobacteriota bacterium]
MSPLKPVSRATLSEQVASQIVEMISAGQILPGEKLPSEHQLCQTLGVGRSTLREALRSLSFVGMVKMRPGEGSFVADGPSRFVDRVLQQGLLNTEKDVRDLAETRIVIETELAALCAQRAAEEDFQRLELLISRMQQSFESGGADFLPLDVEFHFAIASGSQNKVLSQVLRMIRALLEEYIARSLQVPGSAAIAIQHHLSILKALKQRNSQKARAAMLKHLQTFQRGYAILAKASHSEPKVLEVSALPR